MKMWLYGLLMALGAAEGQARLGESTNEIHARYGEPVGQSSVLGFPAQSFTFQQYRVQVVFKNGRSLIETLRPLKEPGRIDPDQARELATRIAQCSQWSRSEIVSPPGFELRGSNGAVAFLRRNQREADLLLICSSEAAAQMREGAPKTPEADADALRVQRQQAINGAPAAQYALARRYLAGDGVPKDEQAARFWMAKAAAKGHAEAKAALLKLDGK